LSPVARLLHFLALGAQSQSGCSTVGAGDGAGHEHIRYTYTPFLDLGTFGDRASLRPISYIGKSVNPTNLAGKVGAFDVTEGIAFVITRESVSARLFCDANSDCSINEIPNRFQAVAGNPVRDDRRVSSKHPFRGRAGGRCLLSCSSQRRLIARRYS
jgi:hypothetical protein